MTALYLVLMMVVIGALIGGITNSIAIRMLFRPYKAIYLGSWRVPFTPGLIPKRRVELADQLGKLVVTHLLTAEGLKKKLESAIFVNEMTDWLKNEIQKFLRSEERITTVIEKWFGIPDGRQKLDHKLDSVLTSRSRELLEEFRPMLVKDVLPKKLNEKVDLYIPELASMIVEKGKEYLQSEEGIERLSNMVDRFLIGRGTLGNMVSMFLGNERLVDKIHPEIIKMLDDEGTHELIQVFLRKEWERLQQSRVEEIEEQINLDKIVEFLKDKVKSNIPLHYIDQPFHEWTQTYEQYITQNFVPSVVKLLGQTISNELVHLLKKLQLEDVVKYQVQQFSMGRLEEMVLSISRRELKLITYLGALLGGFIGLFQGVLLIFLR